VDGIKTGYTRSSGFNLVTSMHRGNRFLVGVVMGGRSGGSRDAIMRGLLAENLSKGATTRTVAAITERSAETPVEVAAAEPQPKAAQAPAMQEAAASPDGWTPPAMRTPAAAKVANALAAATAAVPQAQPKPEARPETKSEARTAPAPLTSGVIQTQAISSI